MSVDLFLTVGALLCFAAAALPSLFPSPRINLVALGLALVTLTLLI